MGKAKDAPRPVGDDTYLSHPTPRSGGQAYNARKVAAAVPSHQIQVFAGAENGSPRRLASERSAKSRRVMGPISHSARPAARGLSVVDQQRAGRIYSVLLPQAPSRNAARAMASRALATAAYLEAESTVGSFGRRGRPGALPVASLAVSASRPVHLAEHPHDAQVEYEANFPGVEAELQAPQQAERAHSAHRGQVEAGGRAGRQLPAAGGGDADVARRLAAQPRREGARPADAVRAPRDSTGVQARAGVVVERYKEEGGSGRSRAARVTLRSGGSLPSMVELSCVWRARCCCPVCVTVGPRICMG